MKLQSLVAGAACALLTTIPAFGSTLVYEGFNYTTGTAALSGANTGSGWTTAWTVDSGSAPDVVSGSIALGSLTVSGNSITQSADATNNSITRSFTAVGTGVTSGAAQTVWLSFVLQGNGNNSGDAYLSLLRNSGSAATDELVRIGRKSGVSGGNITLSSAASTNPAQTAFGNVTFDSTARLLLVKLDLQRSGVGTGTNIVTAQLWTVTSVPADEGALGSSVANFTTATLGSGTGLDKVRLYDASSGANASFDEIRIGDTLSDVTPVPEPSTYAAALGLGALAASCLFRRRR